MLNMSHIRHVCRRQVTIDGRRGTIMFEQNIINFSDNNESGNLQSVSVFVFMKSVVQEAHVTS